MILADGGVSLCGRFGYHRSAAADTCLFSISKTLHGYLDKIAQSQKGFVFFRAYRVF